MKRLMGFAAVAALLVSSTSVVAAERNARPVALNPSMQKVLDDCGASIGNYGDYLACPRIEKYVLRDLSARALKVFLEDERGLSADLVRVEEAVRVLGESMRGQTGYLRDLVEHGEMDRAAFVAVEGFERSEAALSAILRNSASAGAELRVDEDSYWAPSVNSRVIVLIRRDKKTVTIIEHGDTDG